MIKVEELKNPASCLSRARDHEMLFILLGRDVAAPAAIRAWVNARILLGKNRWTDLQIQEALYCAEQMEAEVVGATTLIRSPAISGPARRKSN